MPETTDDLWPPDIATTDVDPEPVKKLKQQGQFLSRKTHGRVEGAVRNDTVDGTVYYSFYLKAAALGDYAFKLLSIAHPVTKGSSDPWPLTVQDSFGGDQVKVDDMDGFVRWLKATLSSEPVKTVIGNMMKESSWTT